MYFLLFFPLWRHLSNVTNGEYFFSPKNAFLTVNVTLLAPLAPLRNTLGDRGIFPAAAADVNVAGRLSELVECLSSAV